MEKYTECIYIEMNINIYVQIYLVSTSNNGWSDWEEVWFSFWSWWGRPWFPGLSGHAGYSSYRQTSADPGRAWQAVEMSSVHHNQNAHIVKFYKYMIFKMIYQIEFSYMIYMSKFFSYKHNIITYISCNYFLRWFISKIYNNEYCNLLWDFVTTFPIAVRLIISLLHIHRWRS